MMLKGADLLAWARRQAKEWWNQSPRTKTVEVVIAEAYLRGAIDALDEEKQEILDSTKIGRLEVGP